jgi:peroxiredoxin
MKWRSLQESGSSTDTRSLRERLVDRKELISRYVPPEVQAIHVRAIGGLKTQGVAANALKAGEKCPSFELPDQNGKLLSPNDLLNNDRLSTDLLSNDLLGRRNLVLMFIRGRWCPFCVAQMEAMSQFSAEFAAAGATLVAISPQTEKQAFFMHDQHKLPFPLLVDAHNQLARQFGLVYRVPEEQQALYTRTFVNLPFINGDTSWELPIPATFAVDGSGDRDHTILFSSVNEDYTDRPEPQDILSAIRLA